MSMTKDELLLQIVEEWWDCIRESELEEGLMGAGGTDPEDVKEHYPDFDNDDADEPVDDQIRKDVRELFKRLKEQAKKKA